MEKVTVVPYSKNFLQRVNQINEGRRKKTEDTEKDPLKTRQTSIINTKSADESKIHYSKKNFGLARPVSASRSRPTNSVVRGNSVSRARSVSASWEKNAEDERKMEMAMVVTKQQYDIHKKLNSKKPWYPGGEGPKHCESPHKSIKKDEAEQKYVVEKAWRRGPWPGKSLEVVEGGNEYEVSEESKNGGNSNSSQRATSPHMTRTESSLSMPTNAEKPSNYAYNTVDRMKMKASPSKFVYQEPKQLALIVHFIRACDRAKGKSAYGIFSVNRKCTRPELVGCIERQFNVHGQISDIVITSKDSNDNIQSIRSLALGTIQENPALHEQCEITVYLGGLLYQESDNLLAVDEYLSGNASEPSVIGIPRYHRPSSPASTARIRLSGEGPARPNTKHIPVSSAASMAALNASRASADDSRQLSKHSSQQGADLIRNCLVMDDNDPRYLDKKHSFSLRHPTTSTVTAASIDIEADQQHTAVSSSYLMRLAQRDSAPQSSRSSSQHHRYSAIKGSPGSPNMLSVQSSSSPITPERPKQLWSAASSMHQKSQQQQVRVSEESEKELRIITDEEDERFDEYGLEYVSVDSGSTTPTNLSRSNLLPDKAASANQRKSVVKRLPTPNYTVTRPQFPSPQKGSKPINKGKEPKRSSSPQKKEAAAAPSTSISSISYNMHDSFLLKSSPPKITSRAAALAASGKVSYESDVFLSPSITVVGAGGSGWKPCRIVEPTADYSYQPSIEEQAAVAASQASEKKPAPEQSKPTVASAPYTVTMSLEDLLMDGDDAEDEDQALLSQDSPQLPRPTPGNDVRLQHAAVSDSPSEAVTRSVANTAAERLRMKFSKYTHKDAYAAAEELGRPIPLQYVDSERDEAAESLVDAALSKLAEQYAINGDSPRHGGDQEEAIDSLAHNNSIHGAGGTDVVTDHFYAQQQQVEHPANESVDYASSSVNNSSFQDTSADAEELNVSQMYDALYENNYMALMSQLNRGIDSLNLNITSSSSRNGSFQPVRARQSATEPAPNNATPGRGVSWSDHSPPPDPGSGSSTKRRSVHQAQLNLSDLMEDGEFF